MTKYILLVLLLISLIACTGGDSNNDSKLSISSQKFLLSGNIDISSMHNKVPKTIYMEGIAPTKNNNNEITIFLHRPVKNGWAARYLMITIKDSNVIDGSYSCISANDTYKTPPLNNQDCFIRYENDNYIGLSETWASTNDSHCKINVINAQLEQNSTKIYKEININLNCENMENVWQFEQLSPLPTNADINSKISIKGNITSIKNSKLPSVKAISHGTNSSLSVSGGNGIIPSNISMSSLASGPLFAKSHQIIYMSDGSKTYELTIHLNAAYDLKGKYNCTNPPIYLGLPIRIKNSECLLIIKKNDKSNIYDYVWDSKSGEGCFIEVTNAENNTIHAPWYNFKATVDCPSMVSRANSYGLNYPFKPDNIKIKGSIVYN